MTAKKTEPAQTLRLLVSGRNGLFYVVLKDLQVETCKSIYPGHCWGITATAFNKLVVATRKVSHGDIHEVPTKLIQFNQELLVDSVVDLPRAKDVHQIMFCNEDELILTSCATNEFLRYIIPEDGDLKALTEMCPATFAMDGEAGWDEGHWNSIYQDACGRMVTLRHGYGKGGSIHLWEEGNDFQQVKTTVVVGRDLHNIIPFGKNKYLTLSSAEGIIYHVCFQKENADIVYSAEDYAKIYLRGAAMVPRWFNGKGSLLIVGDTERIEERGERGKGVSSLLFFDTSKRETNLVHPRFSLLSSVKLGIGPIHDLFVLDRFDACRPNNVFVPALIPGFHL